jgi:GT2 family glycosyltransferase
MKYSFVIISKDRREWLKKVVEQVKGLRLPDSEVIVVEVVDAPQAWPDDSIRYVPVRMSEAGFSKQRNRGVSEAQGEYIIFVDDDVEVSEDWLKELLKPIEISSDVFGVMGAVFPLKPNCIGFCEGVLGHPGGGFKLHHRAQGEMLKLNQVATCNTVIHRQTILDAGGFDERNRFGSEDTDLSIRIHKLRGEHPFRFAAKAIVYHQPRNAFNKLIPWYIRRGKADADLFLKHTTHLPYLVRTSFLLKIIIIILIAALVSLPSLVWGALIIWYLLQLNRTVFMWNYFQYYAFTPIQQLLTYVTYPWIKFTADVMFDVGRIMRWVNRNE